MFSTEEVRMTDWTIEEYRAMEEKDERIELE